jgi:ABC-type cobalamin/Fe3+-siderophores transport system ATPase subunit
MQNDEDSQPVDEMVGDALAAALPVAGSIARGQVSSEASVEIGATGEATSEVAALDIQPPVKVAPPPTSPNMGLVDTRSVRARRWSTLDSITVRGFKAASEATIPLDHVTILVGPNGCGKSSVLQAIHWAARAASYVLPKNTKEMISFERLDYVPSSDPLTTLHKGELRSDAGSPPVEVVFTHRPIGEDVVQATVRIRAARNRGGITAYMDGAGAVTPYKQRYQFITAYIPGLAGLSEKESILAQPTLRRQAASGDAGGVLRNILLNLRSRRTDEPDDTAGLMRLERLNELIQQVHPGVHVNVSFEEREDYHISATIRTEGLVSQSRPLETAATGVLQVVQIFAYLILFEPKILLIDEPDAHLHPDKQERLIEALERVAPEYDTQVILTTHSPHIVRAASPAAKLVWMREGTVETDDDEAIRRLLGWGGLDKAALFFVEDEDDKPLRAILRQWPDLARQIAICRCFGIENLPKDKLLKGLLIDGELKITALLHRDGDFMTPEEAEKWRDGFKTPGVFPWVTEGPDIEAYFCSAEYLRALYGVSAEQAEEWRVTAAKNVNGARKTFLGKRSKVVHAIWPNGGSPDAEAMWEAAGGNSPSTVKGKRLHAALKPLVKAAGFNDARLNSFEIPAAFTMAPDLKAILEEAVKGDPTPP